MTTPTKKKIKDLEKKVDDILLDMCVNLEEHQLCKPIVKKRILELLLSGVGGGNAGFGGAGGRSGAPPNGLGGCG